MDSKKIALIILLVHILHEVQSQLTANLTITVHVDYNKTRKIEFNTTSFQRLLGVLCTNSTDCYSFAYQLSTGHIFDTNCQSGNTYLSGNQESMFLGINYNYNSNEGIFQRISQQHVCPNNNGIIGPLKNSNVTQCGNKCIYIFLVGEVINGFVEYPDIESNYINPTQCPKPCSNPTQPSGTQQASQAATTASVHTPNSQTVAPTTLSTNVFVTYTDDATHNASTELTSKGEPEKNTLIIAVTVSVGATLIITIIIIVCVVVRNRNNSKQHEGRENGVQEKNNTIALDDTYTSTSDYNSIDEKRNGTTIIPVNNKGKSVNQYQNSLSPVKTEDSLSSSVTTNVNGNHVGDIYAVVNKPNTAPHKINTKSQVENTPTSNNVPEGNDDYSYVDKPGSHNSPSRESQATEYSTLHQVNRMPDDTYTHLGEQLARQNHVTNGVERDESGSRERPSDIQIVYLSAKGTGRNDEMKRTSVEI